jgi:hypothetical protein
MGGAAPRRQSLASLPCIRIIGILARSASEGLYGYESLLH